MSTALRAMTTTRRVVVLLLVTFAFSQLFLTRTGNDLSATIQQEKQQNQAAGNIPVDPQPPLSPERTTTDWFQLQAWLENPFTTNCWHVEDICHSSHRWFYNPFSNSPERQPPFSFDLTSGGNPSPGRPGKLVVQPPDPNATIHGTPMASIMKTCTVSPIPNHIVYQGFFNEMLGEFYARNLIWIHLMEKDLAKGAARMQADSLTNFTVNASFMLEVEDQFIKSFREQTQMYLHISKSLQDGAMLNSHHLFTEAFRSNPVLSFTTLLDNAGCRCLKRLILCGYYDTARSGTPVRTLALNTSVATAVGLAGYIGPTTIRRSPQYATAYRDVRTELRRRIVESNAFLQEEMESLRSKAILRAKPAWKGLHFNESEFRFACLTQRHKRRRWLNLNDIEKRCNKDWFRDSGRVICMEVNVENGHIHQFDQAIIHASCDMLIGIHGAQLTEAIWMKDGSAVVELLPWIVPGGFGLWTRTTTEPTPVGEIFHETRLNHIGYPLPRESSPYCENTANETEYRDCMGRFGWAVRDYQVNPDVVLDMITKFLPVNTTPNVNNDNPLPCDEWQQRAGDKQYVLYNVYCTNATNETNLSATVQHYYWPNEVA